MNKIRSALYILLLIFLFTHHSRSCNALYYIYTHTKNSLMDRYYRFEMATRAKPPYSLTCAASLFRAPSRLRATGCGSDPRLRLASPSADTTLHTHQHNKVFKLVGREEDIVWLYLLLFSGAGCGGAVFNTRGSITSPGFPSNVSRLTDCQWEVTVPVGMLIQIDFPGNKLSFFCERDLRLIHIIYKRIPISSWILPSNLIILGLIYI